MVLVSMAHAGPLFAAQDNRPPAGTIAFIRDGNIWTIATDGSNERQLTSGGGYNDPAWSPDGARIAFVQDVYIAQDDVTARQIGLLDVSSLEEEIIVEPETIHISLPGMYYSFRKPQWLPGGRSLLVIAGDGRIQGQNLRQIDLSNGSTTQQQLAFTSGLAVSPLEPRIAYTTLYNAVPAGNSLTIAAADLSESHEALPIIDGRSISAVCWTAGGSSLLVAISEPDGSRGIVKIRPDGSHQETIPMDDWVWSLDCSPTDDSLVYQIEESLWLYHDGTGQAQELTNGSQPSWGPAQQDAPPAAESLIAYYDLDDNVRLVNSDGSGDRLVTDSGRATFNIADMELKWSPDGRYLAFVRQGYEGQPDMESLVVYDVASDALQTVVTDSDIEGFDWWPDSASIVYSPPSPGVWFPGQESTEPVTGLLQIDLVSGESREIVPAERNIPLIRPQVSHDGNYIAVQEAVYEGHGALVFYDVEASHYPETNKVLGAMDWAPNVNAVVYDGLPYMPSPGYQIRFAGPAGDNDYFLTPGSEDSGDMRPKFSPTGFEVAFLRADFSPGITSPAPKTLWSVPFDAFYGDGSLEKQLTTYNVSDFSWAPDGQRLALSAGDYPGYEILVIDDTGGNRQRLATGYGPAWQPAVVMLETPAGQEEGPAAPEVVTATATAAPSPAPTVTSEATATATPLPPTPVEAVSTMEMTATSTPSGETDVSIPLVTQADDSTVAPDVVSIPLVAAGESTEGNQSSVTAIILLAGLGVILGIAALLWYRRSNTRPPSSTPNQNCAHCGAGHPPGARFCPRCGEDLTGGQME
jgi:Tol biopolymer transport system component